MAAVEGAPGPTLTPSAQFFAHRNTLSKLCDAAANLHAVDDEAVATPGPTCAPPSPLMRPDTSADPDEPGPLRAKSALLGLSPRAAKAAQKREGIQVDRNGAVREGLRETDAYQTVVTARDALLRDGGTADVLEERLAALLVEPARARRGVQRQPVERDAQQAAALDLFIAGYSSTSRRTSQSDVFARVRATSPPAVSPRSMRRSDP